MTVFRVLHASDLHFADKPSVVGVNDLFNADIRELGRFGLASSHSPDIAEELLAFVEERKDLDAVLITGDLATTGMAADLKAARRFVEELASIVPVFLVPGNHDRFRNWAASPGGTAFDKIFNWRVGQQKADVIGALEKEGRQLVFVGADLSLPAGHSGEGAFGWAGQGVASEGCIKSLMAETSRAKDKFQDAEIVWAIHFAPEFPRGQACLKLLRDDVLVNTARKAGVHAILVGHTHVPSVYTRRGVDVFCAGSATQHVCSKGNCVHVADFRVGRTSMVKRTDVWWREEVARFEE